MIEVFLSIKRDIDGLIFSAYFIDSQGYETVFEPRRAGSSTSIRKSIFEHFDVLKKDFIIKKE